MNKFQIFRLLSMAFIFVAWRWRTPSSPPRNPPHKITVSNDILSDKQHISIMKVFQDLGEFRIATQDWVSTKWSSIGEDYDANPDGTCPQIYTTLNKNTQKCQYLNRVDVTKHFFESGGYNGHKEGYHKLTHRLNRFINHQTDASSNAPFKDIFESDEFGRSIESICGRQNPYFRPFDLSLVLNIPGQTVAAHLDTAYFWPSTKYAFPEWLLLVMHDSQLFEQQRIPQVQAVLYVHDWIIENKTNIDDYNAFGGQFIAYTSGPEHRAQVIPATPKSGVFCDGSQMVHGTSTFKADMDPIALDMNDNDDVKLKFDEERNVWRLYVNNAATSTSYSWQDIRAAIVYRGWCFNDKDVMEHWDPEEWSGDWTLDDVIDILKRDLIYTKKAISVDKWNRMDERELALYLIDKYIKLPRPALSRIPFNYCGFSKVIENLIC